MNDLNVVRDLYNRSGWTRLEWAIEGLEYSLERHKEAVRRFDITGAIHCVSVIRLWRDVSRQTLGFPL